MPFLETKMKSFSRFMGARKVERAFAAFLFLILTVAALGSKPGFAQAVYGSLYGTVTDSSGAVVPNAKVTVTDTAKGTPTVVTTNGDGFWRADLLTPDGESVKVRSGSFTPGGATG